MSKESFHNLSIPESLLKRLAELLAQVSPSKGSDQPPAATPAGEIADAASPIHLTTTPVAYEPTIEDLRAAIVAFATRSGNVKAAIERLHQATGQKRAGQVPQELYSAAIEALNHD